MGSDHSPSSSSGSRSRMLEVTINSASLNTKNRGPFYVKLWILNQQNSMIQTKKVFPNNPTCSRTVNPTWNQKFVFAIPHTLLVDNKISSVCFEVFRVRKAFLDKSLGKAVGKLQLEKTSTQQVTTNEGDDHEEVVYDDTEGEEEENVYFCTDEESGKGKEETEEVDLCELKGAGRVGVGGGGVLNVEMVVQKGILLRVGEFNWRGYAMEYDEFMGLGGGTEEEKKSRFLMCFGSTTTKD